MLCLRKDEQEELKKIIETLSDLTPQQRAVLHFRFVRILQKYESRVKNINLTYNILRFLVTVGSLLVPALLSIQAPDAMPDYVDPQIMYWTSWAISLAVTTSNGLLTLFKIDKKYYGLNSVLEQLRSEGWQYLELSGRYSGHFAAPNKPTHKNQYVYFCNTIEKIVMRQVEEEYYKLTDPTHTHITSISKNGRLASDTIQPPSPADIATMASPPQNLTAGNIESGTNNRESSCQLSNAEVGMTPQTSPAQGRRFAENSFARNMLPHLNSVPQLVMSPSFNPNDTEIPVDADHITVIHMQ